MTVETKWIRFPEGASSVSHNGAEYQATHEGSDGFWYAEVSHSIGESLRGTGLGFAMVNPPQVAEPAEPPAEPV